MAGMLADEPTVVNAWRKGWDAAHYVRLMRWREAGFRPETVYDIGAYDGRWSEMCSAIFAPKRIILFEPQSALHDRIKCRQVRDGRSDWRVLPYALGESDSDEAIHVTRNNSASSLRPPLCPGALAKSGTEVSITVSVPVRALDGIIAAERLDVADLIKIDVQGFEDKVLDGGKAAISRAAKLVIEVSLREIYAGQPLLFDILRRVAALGFVLEDITEALRLGASGELWQLDLWLRRNPHP
jgi:FkbM family methyltransferase